MRSQHLPNATRALFLLLGYHHEDHDCIAQPKVDEIPSDAGD